MIFQFGLILFIFALKLGQNFSDTLYIRDSISDKSFRVESINAPVINNATYNRSTVSIYLCNAQRAKYI